MARLVWICITALASLSGCASLESTPADVPGDGLTYYMPKKDIKITVIRDTAKTTVSIESTSAYPDLDRPYVLNFKRNLIGKAELKIGINTVGLLGTAKSVSTPNIAEALKNLASSLGAMAGLAAAPAADAACPTGTFTYIYQASDSIGDAEQPCRMTVTMSRIAKSKLLDGAGSGNASLKAKENGGSGYFYRQEEAYRIDVDGTESGAATRNSAIVLSPSQSPVRFLPVTKTLFASSTADFTFTDGVPIRYDQDADGELVALFKLPADVIGAYFLAVGKILGDKADASTKESAALLAGTQLEMAKLKYKECVDAIKSKDDVLIQKLGCGK
jgi:hypothetical protein